MKADFVICSGPVFHNALLAMLNTRNKMRNAATINPGDLVDGAAGSFRPPRSTTNMRTSCHDNDSEISIIVNSDHLCR